MKNHSWRGFSAILCMRSPPMLAFMRFMLVGGLLLACAYRHPLRTIKVRLPAQIERKWMRRITAFGFEIHRPRCVTDFLETRDAACFG